MGDAVFAIEENLPAVLPSTERANLRKERSKAMENDALLRYIQKMTYEVGGIEAEDGEEYLQLLNTQQTSTSGTPTISSSSSSSSLESNNATMTMQTTPGNPVTDNTVELFAEKMRYLEKAIGIL